MESPSRTTWFIGSPCVCTVGLPTIKHGQRCARKSGLSKRVRTSHLSAPSGTANRGFIGWLRLLAPCVSRLSCTRTRSTTRGLGSEPVAVHALQERPRDRVPRSRADNGVDAALG